MANTSIKLAGGVSAKDARALADDFRCSSDFLLGQKKKRTESHFACFARNVTDQAVSLSIPLGYVESGKTLSAQSVASLIEESRKKYGTVYVEEPAQADTPVESAADWLGGKEEEIVEPPITSSIPASIPAVAIPAEVAEAPIVIVREEAVPRKDAPRDPGGGGVKHKYLNI